MCCRRLYNTIKTKDFDPWLKEWNENWTPPEELLPIIQEDTIPKLLDCYYTDLQDNKITNLTAGIEVYLVVRTKNAIGKIIDIDLNNKNIDFICDGEIVTNDILKGIKITSVSHRVKLKTIKQQS